MGKALLAAAEKGILSLQLDAQQVIDTQRRTGRLVGPTSSHNEVAFGVTEECGEYVITTAKVSGTSWNLRDYGDTIPTVPGYPMLDVYHPGPVERNKCLLIHLVAAILWAPGSDRQNPNNDFKLGDIHRLGRDLRYRQYQQVMDCLPVLGPVQESEPLALAELRAHAHDLGRAHHDRGHRSIVCFPPEELSQLNLAIIRVIPSGRYTVHHIESRMRSNRWAYLLSYRGHMRMAVPVGKIDSQFVRTRPNSVSRPVGWKYVTKLGGGLK